MTCICGHNFDEHRETDHGFIWCGHVERHHSCDCREYIWDESKWDEEVYQTNRALWLDLLSRLTPYQNAFAEMIVIVEKDPLYTGGCTWSALRLEAMTRLYVLGMYDESAWTF